ncbi:unnamed protein product [Arctogadus glacialis]
MKKSESSELTAARVMSPPPPPAGRTSFNPFIDPLSAQHLMSVNACTRTRQQVRLLGSDSGPGRGVPRLAAPLREPVLNTCTPAGDVRPVPVRSGSDSGLMRVLIRVWRGFTPVITTYVTGCGSGFPRSVTRCGVPN